jgi:hypothetical protein
MLKGFLGAALGAGMYLYSNVGGPSTTVRMAAYLGGVGLIAWTLTTLTRAFLRAFRAYRRTAMYVLRSKLIVHSEGLRATTSPRTAVSAVIVLDEQPSLAGLLALASA